MKKSKTCEKDSGYSLLVDYLLTGKCKKSNKPYTPRPTPTKPNGVKPIKR